MNILSYCFAIISLLFVYGSSGFPSTFQLYENSDCTTSNGTEGTCKKLPDCPPILDDVLNHRRSGATNGRCGFSGDVEIVCCPTEFYGKILPETRAADRACRELENEVESTNSDGDTSTSMQKSDLVLHILGGTEAAQYEFPYMAVLGYNDTDGNSNNSIAYRCGGTLISSTYILTAAHCVLNTDANPPIMVRLGSVNKADKGPDIQEIKVAERIVYPTYRRSRQYHDVALVRLDQPARMSNNVKPICLQTRRLQDSNINSNTTFLVIGFGATELAGDSSDKLMKSANLNLIPNTECSESYANFDRLPRGFDDNMLCTLDANVTRRSDACQGDSGGPLLMISGKSQTVMGITSFGQTCGSSIPGVYMSVYSYLDWIESKVWPTLFNAE